MALFKTREAQTIEAVRTMLAEAEAAAIVADRALKGAALVAALSPDPFAAKPQHEALRRAREKVELLRHALAEAEQRERDRLARAKEALRASQNRAIRQHLSAVTRAAKHYETATRNAVSAFDDAILAAEAIRKLLPPGREAEWFAEAVSARRLHQAFHAELNRQSANKWGKRAGLTAPGAAYPGIGFEPWNMQPLSDLLKGKLLAQFDWLTGKNPPPAEPPPEPTPRPASAPTPAVANPVAQANAPPTDPHGGMAVHTNDPGARAEYDAELARAKEKPAMIEPEVEPIFESTAVLALPADRSPANLCRVKVAAADVADA